MAAVETDGAKSEDEFDTWRWHDNLIYGLSVDIGDTESQDWRSDLIFDIDFIVEWLRQASGEFRFRVAPAALAFQTVSDLSIDVDHGDSGGRNALTEWCIDRVIRDRLDRPFDYWRWTIHLNVPCSGKIKFCASGFTLTLRSEPRLVMEQRLRRAKSTQAAVAQQTLTDSGVTTQALMPKSAKSPGDASSLHAVQLSR
jgi:hypothetical protein